MTKPLLIMFVGIPGSGKTTFAKNIAATLHAVTLNSDSIRIDMWGSLEAIRETHATPEERKKTNKLTFGAMNYAARQILHTGTSVVYDCNANHRWERDEKHEIARQQDAISVIVRIQVPYEVSFHRIQHRDESHDQRKFVSVEKAKGVLDRFMHEIEEPHADELTVHINGEDPFEQQFVEFQRQLESHTT